MSVPVNYFKYTTVGTGVSQLSFHRCVLLVIFGSYNSLRFQRSKHTTASLSGFFLYSHELKQRILNKEELPQGGEEEVEIRAATVHAVEEANTNQEKYFM